MRRSQTRRAVARVATLVLLVLLAACGGAADEQTAAIDNGPPTVEQSKETSSGDQPTIENAEPPVDVTPALEDLVATVKTGVVRIRVETCDGPQIGTGIIVGPRLVATVEHVVEGAVVIDLQQRGQSVGEGTVIGYDVERDVALIRADRPLEGHEFVFASRAPRLGEDIATIGFPFGLTVNRGVVSGLKKTIEIEGIKRRRLVQTDAAVNPGNSGGPLFSVRTGEVVGLVSAGLLDANSIAFAIPARTVAQLVEAWKNSPQPVAARSCTGGEPPPVTASGGGSGETYSGYFTSFDRLETCYADDAEAFCVALPSGKAARLTVGEGADFPGLVADGVDMGGPALSLGDSFTTPVGLVTCESSNRGISCIDNTTGSYFVIGDYAVKINNGGGEEGY